ncbi:uncharacterized protein RSE6_02920 [Rhynchosporium secalis]|uniref:DUF6590 domain-containing protein n=1 Tax=Rhynchosporium secalis TaxID=38038 RepID=A0A1E1M1H9_RHYSE|nr:uncharacterized protein RSE6_02920 [Rhynchosporium secalis]
MAPQPPKSGAKNHGSPPGSPDKSNKRILRSSVDTIAKVAKIDIAKVTKKPKSAKDRRKANLKAGNNALAEEAAVDSEIEVEPEEDAVAARAPAPELELVKAELIDVGVRQDYRDFKLGHVITRVAHSTFIIDPAFGNETPPDMITWTKFGPVYSKPRKFVIIARFLDHMVCLPIFSYGGSGLSRKPNKKEYVGIRDAQYFFNTIDESPNGPALIVERKFRVGKFFGKKDRSVVNGTSYVQITQPVCVLYIENCTIDSLMKIGDLTKLISLYNQNRPNPDAPPAVRPPPRVRN